MPLGQKEAKENNHRVIQIYRKKIKNKEVKKWIVIENATETELGGIFYVKKSLFVKNITCLSKIRFLSRFPESGWSFG